MLIQIQWTAFACNNVTIFVVDAQVPIPGARTFSLKINPDLTAAAGGERFYWYMLKILETHYLICALRRSSVS